MLTGSERKCGETVTFDGRNGPNTNGVIVRINQRTATIGTAYGNSWRVPLRVLRRALDM